jgi:hypothetical protein
LPILNAILQARNFPEEKSYNIYPFLLYLRRSHVSFR